jgi:hypothetical protein
MEGHGARGGAGNGTATTKRIASITVSPSGTNSVFAGGPAATEDTENTEKGTTEQTDHTEGKRREAGRPIRFQHRLQSIDAGRLFCMEYESVAVETLRAPIAA